MNSSIQHLDKPHKRDQYFQYIRGICILMVVLIHGKTGIQYFATPVGSWNFDFWLIFRQIINFPVAVLIFLSGYFTNTEKAIEFPVNYIIKRFKRLGIPFLVWSVIYTTINIFSSSDIEVSKTLLKFVLGMSAAPLYYIIVLLQLTILTPFLAKLVFNNKHNLLLLLITPVYLLGLYIYSSITKDQFILYQSLFPAWFIFYYFGLKMKINGFSPLFKSGIKLSLFYVIVALLLSVIEGYLLIHLNFPIGFACSQIKISSFMYSISIINVAFLLFSKKNLKPSNRVFIYLGDKSFGIFFVHMIWIIISTRILSNLHFIDTILPVYLFFQTLFVMVFSLVTVCVLKCIFGFSFSQKILGLE